MNSTLRHRHHETQSDHATIELQPSFFENENYAPHSKDRNAKDIYDGLDKVKLNVCSMLDDGMPLVSTPSRPPSIPVANFANLDFRQEKYRLLSLQKWPAKNFMNTEVAAKSGLYYYGDGDKVRCHFCRLELGKWEDGDCADADHGRWAPTCPLLLKKPTDNVPIGSESVESKPSSSDECGIYESRAPKHPAFMTEHTRLESFRNWPSRMKQSPRSLADAGFYYAGASDQTVCYHCGGGLKDWEDEDDPWEQHALWFTRCPYLVMVKGQAYIDGVLRAKESPEGTSAPVVAPSEVPKPKSETERLSDAKECKVCLSNERNVCFIPCGHVVACPKCAMSLLACPICRSDITGTVKVYFP